MDTMTETTETPEQEETEAKFIGTGTYSPDDNKLRLYPFHRLDKELYLRVKAAGFGWAPKQELFVAPMWTPAREDLLTELCGEIGDEDTTLTDRAEQRADRFEHYSEKRHAEGDAAHQVSDQIAERFYGGQPILVGHHSEKRARKDQERIHTNMRKAVSLWKTSTYWKDRAAGAIGHAKYKEMPRVRANRIKTIEADQRKNQRNRAQCERGLKVYTMPDILTKTRDDGSLYVLAMLDSYELGLNYEGQKKIKDGTLTIADAVAIKIRGYHRSIAHIDRWNEHYDNRLSYEKAMLEDQGASALLDKKPRPEQLPLLNYRAAMIQTPNLYNRGEMMQYPQVEMTKAEYMKLYEGSRWCVTVDGTHRVRVASGPKYSRNSVFLTDSKVHPIPAPKEKKETPPYELTDADRARIARPAPEPDPVEAKIKAVSEALKTGVKVVIAPQLFPTPPELAAKMVSFAGLEKSQTILEPSAGTGRIIDAISREVGLGWVNVHAVEINQDLADALRVQHTKTDAYKTAKVVCADFLEMPVDPLCLFDRILMNPPFKNGADIKHILHALKFLRPGGRLVAICANGNRQREALQNIATHWEDLPPGTFSEEGTGVNTALVVIDSDQPAIATPTGQLDLI